MRRCIRCKRDLGEEMGVIVFVPSKLTVTRLRATSFLLCLEHGANGQNTISLEEMSELTGMEWK